MDDPFQLEEEQMTRGECNRCGQCCGAEGSPEQASPWPRKYPQSIRNWQYEDVLQIWPQAILFGLIKKGLPDENVGPVKQAGYTILHRRKFRWIWIEDKGICKDLFPYGGPPYSLECPLLDGEPGDEVRPCALFGTDFEWMQRRACNPFPRLPPSKAWYRRHPLCSIGR